MRIAYFSPLNPQKSGISDYSEELLQKLCKEIEIDIFVDGYELSNKKLIDKMNVYMFDQFEVLNHSEKYDLLIYHIGNNVSFHEKIYNYALEYPGLIVFHDYYIHLFVASMILKNNTLEELQRYVEEMKFNHGTVAGELAEKYVNREIDHIWTIDKEQQYPMNTRLIERSRGVLVHSQFLVDRLNQEHKKMAVFKAPLPSYDLMYVSEKASGRLRRKYGIDSKKVIFASFGYMNEHKGIYEILSTIGHLKNKMRDFKYILVGGGDEQHINRKIQELGIEEFVEYVGYVEPGVFKDYMKMIDFGVNIRKNTYGESSATLANLMGYGKATIVSNIGAFREIPDTCVVKVESENLTNDLEAAIEHMLRSRKDRIKIGKMAFDYTNDRCKLSDTKEAYMHAIESIVYGSACKGNAYVYERTIRDIGDILDEFEIEDENTILSLSKAIDSLIS